jgi:hypothetical protein
MPAVYANNAFTQTTGASGTTAPSAGTSETWVMVSAASFPSVNLAGTPSTWFHLYDPNPALAYELIKVTLTSGSSFTVTRGDEGTTPVAHSAGATFYLVASGADLPTSVNPLALAAGGSGYSAASAAALLANLGAAPVLSQAGVKTSAYTATANQVVSCDISGGSFAITLPAAPAAGTLFAAAVVAVSGVGVNTLTLTAGGSDVFDKSGGTTTATMTLLHQSILYEYNSGVWAKISSADPYLQVALNRQGTYFLDQYAGTDDAKMALALAAVVAAGGGTIILSPRPHTFANQWTTAFVNQATVCNIRILGAGAGGPGGQANNAYGITQVIFTYNSAGAGQMDFQHNGNLEIAGIWFYDTAYTVPFLFTTAPTPKIHDCAFTGVGSRATCTKDAIILGGPGTGETGNNATVGDLSKFSGYGTAYVRDNYFDSIRRAVTFGGGCNSVNVSGNCVSQLCGDTVTPFSAPFYFNGNATHGCAGNHIFDNYVEGTYYNCLTSCAPSATASMNTVGPNSSEDAANFLACYWDATSTSNTFIDTSWRTAASSQAVLDMAGSNAIIGGGFGKSRVITESDFLVQPVTRTPSIQSPAVEGLRGDRAWMTVSGAGSVAADLPLAQVVTQKCTSVTDGVLYSGSPWASSVSAVWSSHHEGSFIASLPTSAGVPALTRILATFAAASTNCNWFASAAVVQGQVVTPTTANSHLYQCTVAGTTGTTQPTWPTGGTTVADGTATWIDLGTAATAVLMNANATAAGTGVTLAYLSYGGASVAMTGFINHHIQGSGSVASWVIVPAGIGTAGNGATVTVTGNDLGQQVTITTASTGTAPGQMVTGTSNNSAAGGSTASVCSLTPANAAAATLMSTGGGCYITQSGSTPLWKIFAVGTPPASTVFVFNVNTLG